jgi:hypothetical protein
VASFLHLHQVRPEAWAEDEVRQQHLEALFAFGEWACFALMWRPADEAAGLVERCSTCYVGEGRAARAFRQGAQEKCPNCYGTTFEGGYRARVIRPAIFTDRVADSQDAPRGTLVTDQVTVETTIDFTFHRGDYVFRASGERYQGDEKNAVVVRSGFDNPDQAIAVAGSISQARLEDKASVAYLIPPTPEVLATVLRRPVSEHLPADLSAYEVTDRGPTLL